MPYNVGAGLVPAQGTHKGSPYVVMPDHFHALVRIPRPVGAGLVPALCPKIGVLCSRKVPPDCNLEPPETDSVFLGGFHSPPEKQILERLLDRLLRNLETDNPFDQQA